MSHSVDETYELYVESTVRRARRPHVCSACKETIPVGSTYTNVFIVFQNEPERLKRCGRCQKIHLHLRSLGDSETWPDERLNCGESYRTHWGEDPPADIAALAFALPGEVTS